MSHSLPGRVVSVEPRSIGIVEISGVAQRVRLGLVTTDGIRVAVGDWVLVRHGLALAAVDAAELPTTA